MKLKFNKIIFIQIKIEVENHTKLNVYGIMQIEMYIEINILMSLYIFHY